MKRMKKKIKIKNNHDRPLEQRTICILFFFVVVAVVAAATKDKFYRLPMKFYRRWIEIYTISIIYTQKRVWIQYNGWKAGNLCRIVHLSPCIMNDI